MDMIGVITPYDKFNSNHVLFEHMFDINEKSKLEQAINNILHFNTEDELSNSGTVIVDKNMFPTLWSIVAISKSLNKRDMDYPQDIFNDTEFGKFSSNFLSQLSQSNDENNLVKNIARMSYLLSQGNGEDKFHSLPMQSLEQLGWHNEFPQFCDLFLFHQIKEVLFRQLAVPYHVNTSKTKRWKYKAKETPMYMDLLILDECRYLYDWMPTIDMMTASLNDFERHLSFRFILDGLSKHRRYYNSEFFFGTACIGANNDGFESKQLSPRVDIQSF